MRASGWQIGHHQVRLGHGRKPSAIACAVRQQRRLELLGQGLLGEVGSADVADDTTANALQGADIATNSLSAADFADNSSLGTEETNEADLFNDNSLTAGDVADTSPLGTAEINEGSLFNDNSLIGVDINESLLNNPVPLSQNAQNANTLDGIDSTALVIARSDTADPGECRLDSPVVRILHRTPTT